MRAHVLERDRGICGLCGRAGADTAGHIIPRARGGSDHPSNLRAEHGTCPDGSGGNYAQGDRVPGRPSPSRAW